MSVHYSSESVEWSTPQDLFDRLNRAFRFTVDVCATDENAKVPLYYTKERDGLKYEWFGNCWMNPPYGREIGNWVAKALVSARQNGATVVCLLPARTDTQWWNNYCTNGEITFLKGRLKFGGCKNSAPFPSAIVVFRPTVADAMEVA